MDKDITPADFAEEYTFNCIVEEPDQIPGSVTVTVEDETDSKVFYDSETTMP